MITPSRDQIIQTARSYLGTRFVFKGRSKAGLDCVGLICRVGWDLGYEFPDDQTYDKNPQVEMFQKIVWGYSDEPTNRTMPKPGQIAILRQSVFPMHTGIVSRDEQGLTIINANMRERKVVEQRFKEWNHLLMAVREYPGVK